MKFFKAVFYLMFLLILFLSGCGLSTPTVESVPKPRVETLAPAVNEQTQEEKGEKAQNENIHAYGKLSQASNTVINSQGKDACFAVYQEMPFEDGTLILAGLTEGEAYPELYFVDGSNEIAFQTDGSDVYMLNYTEFKGRLIFFGKAAAEKTKGLTDKTGVEKVTAKYKNEESTVKPYRPGTLIAVKNPQQSEERYGESAQGYILASNAKELPQALFFQLENGETANVSDKVFEREAKEHLPPYLNTESLRKTCVYKYSPMRSAAEIKIINEMQHLMLKRKEMESEALYVGSIQKISDEALTTAVRIYAGSCRHINNSFPAGSHVSVVNAGGKKLSCYAAYLTKECLESSAPWHFDQWAIREDNTIKVPAKSGYYLFVLCIENPEGFNSFMGIERIK